MHSQASGCKKLFSVGLIGGRSDTPIFLHLLLQFIPSEFHPLHSEFSFDTTAEMGRKAHGSPSRSCSLLPKGSWPQSHSSGRLFLPPAPVALGFPEHKLLLSFSRISNTFLGNFRRTTYPPTSYFLSVKDNQY